LRTCSLFADNEKVKSYKTLSGQRKFDKLSLEEMCSSVSTSSKTSVVERTNIIYARVSSKKQLDDLSRQVEFIKGRRSEYASYKLVTDIASGINFKRKGLETILDACVQNNIGEVVVAHRDRLSRFGYDLIELLVKKAGGSITVIDDERNKTSEQELSEDLLSIIHIYSCRQMGKRSYKAKDDNKITKN
jgi:predicted site-specific integrase-resolvase